MHIYVSSNLEKVIYFICFFNELGDFAKYFAWLHNAFWLKKSIGLKVLSWIPCSWFIICVWHSWRSRHEITICHIGSHITPQASHALRRKAWSLAFYSGSLFYTDLKGNSVFSSLPISTNTSTKHLTLVYIFLSRIFRFLLICRVWNV